MDELDNWNPMAEDFTCRQFNSYQDPNLSRLNQDLDLSNLYVTNIPDGFEQHELQTCMSKYGSVTRCFLSKPQENKPRIAFVRFETERDAEKALQNLNGKSPLNIKLQYARKSEKRVGRDFKRDSDSSRSNGDINELRSFAKRPEHNAPLFKDVSLCSGRGSGRGYVKDSSPNNTLSIKLTGCGREVAVLQDSDDTRQRPRMLSEECKRPPSNFANQISSKSQADGSKLEATSNPTEAPALEQPLCTLCGNLSQLCCSNCKIPYCSEKCQSVDWHQHKSHCHPQSNATRNHSTDSNYASGSSGSEYEVHPRMRKNVDYPSSYPKPRQAPKKKIELIKSPKSSKPDCEDSRLVSERDNKIGTFKAKSADVKACLSRAEDIWVPEVPSIFTQLKMNTRAVIRPVISQEECLWTLISDDIETLGQDICKIEKELAQLDQQELTAVSEGDVVAAFCEAYQAYFRAIVTRKYASNYAVQYIDYGNQEKVSKIVAVPPDLKYMKSYLVYFKKPSSISSAKFQEIIPKDLFSEVDVMSVSRKLIQVSVTFEGQKYSIECLPWWHETKQMPALPMLKKKNGLKFQKLPQGKTIKAIIHHMEDNMFYIQKVEDESKIEDLSQKLNKLDQSLKLSQNPSVNDVCCGLFSCDNLWYRISIEECLSDGMYSVKFIDYGNGDRVAKENMRYLPDDCFSVPVFCFPVTVINKQLVVGKNVLIQVINEKAGVQYAKIVDHNENTTHTDIPIQKVHAKGALAIPKISSFKKQTLPVGTSKLVVVYIQDRIVYAHKELELASLSALIEDLERNDLTPVSCDVNVGDVLCGIDKTGIDSTDVSTFRCCVLKVFPTAKECDVQNLDFGIVTRVKLQDLRHLPEKYFTVPQYAIPCTIKGSVAVNIQQKILVKVDQIYDGVHTVEVIEVAHRLPSDQNIEVTVSFLQNNIVYVQKSSELVSLEKMKLKLQSFNAYANYDIIHGVGDLVCVNYSGSWYRGRIMNISRLRVITVYFIDYGNTERCSLQKIHPQPKELQEIPNMCYPVIIVNASSLEEPLNTDSKCTIKVIGQSADGVQLASVVTETRKIKFSDLKPSMLRNGKRLEVVVQNIEKNHCYFNKVEDLDTMAKMEEFLKTCKNLKKLDHSPIAGEVILAEYDGILQRGCIKDSRGNDLYTVSLIDIGAMELINIQNLYCFPEELISFEIFCIKAVVTNITTLKQPITPQKKCNIEVIGFPREMMPHIVVIEPPMISEMALVELPLNSGCNVVFVHAENGIYYVQRNILDSTMIQEVAEELLKCSPVDHITHNPVVGEVLICRSNIDKIYYRGCVEQIISHNQCKIKFIDYGNCEVLPRENLQVMVESLREIPVLCIPVVFDASSSQNEAVNLEQQYTIIKEKTIKDGLQVVRLEVEDTPEKIEVVTPKMPEVVRDLAPNFYSSRRFFITDYSYVPLPPGEQDILIYSVQCGRLLFCAPFNQKNMVSNVELSTRLTEYCNQLSCSTYNGIKPLQPEELVIANYSADGNWYRAAVLDDASHQEYEICFIDYGNTETLKQSCLRKMEEKFMELEIQAQACHLEGISVTDEEKVLEELKKFIIFEYHEPLRAIVSSNNTMTTVKIPKITKHLIDVNLASPL